MTVSQESERRFRLVTGTVAERRRRTAALLGLVLFLALAVLVLALVGPGSQSQGMVGVLQATRQINAGTTITSDELGVTYLRAQDPSVLTTLVLAPDRSKIVGQTAVVGVPAGSLLPAGITSVQSVIDLWVTNVPVRRMPADLKPGDHVALVVIGSTTSGQSVEFVMMQDVEVLGVGSGSADLWLPAKVVAQVEWAADHGGIVLVRMPPGAVQSNLPVGGGP